MEQAKLAVYLPKELEQQLYAVYAELAEKAVADVTRRITVNDRYLNQGQLCKYFSCSLKVVREWQTQGLKSFRKGREVMFDLKDVHAFLETQKF